MSYGRVAAATPRHYIHLLCEWQQCLVPSRYLTLDHLVTCRCTSVVQVVHYKLRVPVHDRQRTGTNQSSLQPFHFRHPPTTPWTALQHHLLQHLILWQRNRRHRNSRSNRRGTSAVCAWLHYNLSASGPRHTAALDSRSSAL